MIDHSASLLELEPDFGAALPAERRDVARRRLTIRTLRRPKGPWRERPDHAGIGLLIVGGAVLRQVETEPTGSAELLGPGDIVRPWDPRPHEPVDAGAGWTALSPLDLAVLDASFVARLAGFPELIVDISRRLACRADWLAEAKAISQLTGVEDRLLSLFGHLAFRWGKMTRDGRLVPIPLAHSTIAALIGARRPTVTTALGHLAARDALVRRDDGSWLLLDPEAERPTARHADTHAGLAVA